MVASAWWHGFRVAICVPLLTMILVAFGPAAWKSGVAFYQGRIAAFSGLDAWDTASDIQGDPFSTFRSHPNQFGFASYSYSPIAGAFSLYFDADAGSGAHITGAELACTRGADVPLKIVGTSYAFLFAAPTGCRSLIFTITDGAGGMLDDYFDLTGQFPEGMKA